MNHNQTDDGYMVGIGSTKCQQLINTFRPKKLEISIPGNNSELWQCDEGLNTCTKKSIGDNATRIGYDSANDYTIWQVPPEWGC